MSIARSFGPVLALALGACAAKLPMPAAYSPDPRFAAVAPAETAPLVGSAFEQMQGALPSFELRRIQVQTDRPQEVSIVRDITFGANDTILTDTEVTRLAPLQTYLRLHPAVAVRIEGYGDGTRLAERERDLSSARADAVARALYVDMRVSNPIVAKPAVDFGHRQLAGQAEVTFLLPQ